MRRGVRWYLVGSLVLVALAGCGRSILQYAEREPWRRAAETACLRSGSVKEKPGLVRIEPIEGPGVCGAQYPLKVAALGDMAAFGFADEAVRPPGSVPRSAQQPRWPIAAPNNPPPGNSPPMAQPRMVWSAGPPPASHAPAQTAPALPEGRMVTGSAPPRFAPPVQHGPPGAPLSLTPPGLETQIGAPQTFTPPPQNYGPPPAYPQASPNYSPMPSRAAPPPDREREIERRPQHAPVARPVPALGPLRGPPVTGAVPVEVKPTATLACPIVSALDQWIAAAVQPAAHKWFGQPVVEIKQISAYSCRGMNGQVGTRISEHAFGNALDIAAFVLADGKRITVKGGWQGSAEEQAFLRDVQGAACESFTTVLAPGSNRFHYDHIHVDLMRRASGRRVCNPHAVDGEVIAARVRRDPTMVASAAPERRDMRPPTRRSSPAFDPRQDPFAYRRGDPTPTGSIGSRKAAKSPAPDDDDDDWIEDDGPRPEIDWSTSKHKQY